MRNNFEDGVGSYSMMEGTHDYTAQIQHPFALSLSRKERTLGKGITTWRHLKTLRIRDALPMQQAPIQHPRHHGPRQPNGILVCGELDNPTSIHWALYSGRRVAEAILSDEP